MIKELEAKQDTIVCQVCEEVIDILEGTAGVKTWYGICPGCSKEKKQG